MLLGLLPGLRQLRAPFTTGVLYLLVAWLAFDGRDHLPRTSDRGALGRIADLSQLVGPGATLAAAGLCAYLLGTFVVIRDWPQFFTFSHWRTLPYALSQEDFNSAQLRNLAVAFVWEPLLRLAFWRRWRTQTSVFSELGDWRRRDYPYDDDLFDPVYPYHRADGLGTEMSVRSTHSWAGSLDNWVWRHMDNLHRTFSYEDLKSLDPPDDFWNAVHDAWREFREFLWRRANNEFEYRGGNWDGGRDSASQGNVQTPARLFDLRADQIPPWRPSSSGWDENPAHEWWDLDKNLSENVHHVVLSEAYLEYLPDERKRIIAKLKARGEIHFNDYDRAKAEAELRYSISVPLALLAAVLAVSWSPVSLVGLILPIALVRQGLAIERAAYADLYSALQYGGIESPTMSLLYEARDRAKRAQDAMESGPRSAGNA